MVTDVSTCRMQRSTGHRPGGRLLSPHGLSGRGQWYFYPLFRRDTETQVPGGRWLWSEPDLLSVVDEGGLTGEEGTE